ncbi:MAG: nucleoside phosphorylase [bacterium]|nr:nucleoside phosphorylase [bacterium]
MTSFPILEFDDSPTAVLEPSRIHPPFAGMPERCVICFFNDVLTEVCKDLPVIVNLSSEIGKNPVYALEVEGQRIAVVHPGVGASLSATFLEELIAYGVRTFIACGGAGVLNREITLGHLVVPTSAIRDEGTSYHYLPPAREVSASPEAVQAIEVTLNRHGFPYILGKTWTTDAPYRETAAKVLRRKDEGCVTVEMEAAAFFAVAQFRGVIFGQILYGGDDVSGEDWDHRDWHKQASTREKLFWLAAEAVVSVNAPTMIQPQGGM